MSKVILILSGYILITANSYSQTGWVQQNSGTTSNLNCVYFVDTTTGFAVGNSVFLKTTDGGSNWSSQSSSNLISVFFIDVNTGYIGGVYYVYKTTNGGTTWNTSYYNNLLLGANSIYFINSMTGIVAGTWYVVKLAGGVILRTTDGGTTWNTAYFVNPASFLTVNFPDPLIGYAGGIGPLIKTNNSGQTWNPMVSSPNIQSLYFINTLTGWSAGNSYVYKTTNGGNNWSSTNLPISLYSVRFVNDQNGWVCGSNGAIYGSTDGGVNWTLQSAFTTTYLYSLSFANAQTGWAAGANGRILKTTTGGLTYIEPISNEIPEEYKLYQNFPNPFNPTTKIKFDTPPLPSPKEREFVHVKLVIFDILGSEVATLVNEGLKPGSYEVQWDASNFASGIYFFKLIVGAFIATRKMVLLK